MVRPAPINASQDCRATAAPEKSVRAQGRGFPQPARPGPAGQQAGDPTGACRLPPDPPGPPASSPSHDLPPPKDPPAPAGIHRACRAWCFWGSTTKIQCSCRARAARQGRWVGGSRASGAGPGPPGEPCAAWGACGAHRAPGGGGVPTGGGRGGRPPPNLCHGSLSRQGRGRGSGGWPCCRASCRSAQQVSSAGAKGEVTMHRALGLHRVSLSSLGCGPCHRRLCSERAGAPASPPPRP